MSYKTLKDFDLNGKRVLLRADLNVPSENGEIRDTTRIDRLKPTIDYLRSAGAKTLVLSHFQRPKGKIVPEMSLAFLAPVLASCWNTPVDFIDSCTGDDALARAQSLISGSITLLENTRFYEGEEKNDPVFAQALSKLGDIYVNDAFSTAHRAHASTEGLAHILPSAAGLLMEEELNALDKALGNPQTPVMAVAGGSKISTKLELLKNLVQKTDMLVLGGGMANTFLHAKGNNMGNSICERDMADTAREIMTLAESHNCELILPIDVVAAAEVAPNIETQIYDAGNIPDNLMALDAGPKTRALVSEKMKSCKTLVWNGPMGVFEIKPFDEGTNTLAQEAARLTKSGNLISVAGGGDTVSALKQAGADQGFTYVSTAGGAFLEWLEGKTLPGVAALEASRNAA